MDETTRKSNKRFTLEEAHTQLKRLNKVGIDFSVNIILGAAGSGKYKENTIAMSELLNEVNPYLIFIATMHVDPGSALFDEMKAGTFVENTLRDNLLEELELLKRLNFQKTTFYGLYTSNVIPLVGTLPTEQDKLIERLEHRIKSLPQDI